MNKTILKPDICVIGAGSGGLSVAAGAAAFGVDVVLIEKGKMGGDCLNYGCVPSKALLAIARKTRASHGLPEEPLTAAFDDARVHVRETIEAIAPHDSQERFEGLGVTVLRGAARFQDPETVVTDTEIIKARRFVIATGSSPLIPPIPGLDQVPFFTNETLFEELEPKHHLLIVGGGPIGLEMAQAHRRLGAKVTIIEAKRILPRDHPDHVEILRRSLIDEGIDILEDSLLTHVASTPRGVTAMLKGGGGTREIIGSHLLLATGRKPNVEGLGLAEAQVETSRSGIKVDKALRSTNRKVYAIGDVNGGPQFTHAAGTQAGLILRALLFRLPVRFSGESIPWVTYTAPEVAHVGLRLEDARARYGKQVTVLEASYEGNDRARADGAVTGGLKLYAGKGGRLLGADIVGAQAGELAALLSFAYGQKAKMKDLAGLIAPYPTLSELIRRAAVSYYAEAPKNPWVRRLLNVLRRFG